ncbi:sulfatase [Marinovum sp. 2_MG-2023]|uniref:sulfatase family protein n=1 Tax=unclassified Marinovum TaxID=2647166 RepID=UPI0026E1C040|nr:MULTISPECIES: sulfatase [unclassified Marinovum]MDO6732176.1 sulfatase [Marinovum sp. 2_MG-2023]MDO6781493.1 sulfatase [Marinovum sp. 1_MG-2023]
MTDTAKKHPNILIIYPDQMRYDTMACSGNPVIKTPNIDRLSMEGVHFSEAYTSYPICCPFRASMQTGKYAQGHGMVQNHFPLRGDQTFLADCLKGAGYRTGYIGKWHLEGGPKPGFVPPERRFGFEHFVGFNRGHDYQGSIYFDDAGQAYHSKRYEPDYQTDQLMEFIDTATKADDGKPWFGYVSYGPPHFPMQMPDHLRKIYSADEVPLPPGVPNAALQEEFQRIRSEQYCKGDPRSPHKSHAAYDKKPKGEPETEAEIRQFIAEYYGMIHNVDWNVGRVLNQLDALGIADDTMVIFLSDHGDMLGQHGSFCGIKCEGYRAAMHVPLIIRYPARFKPHRSEAMVDVGVDMMPTLLDLCGIPGPDDMHGISYLPVLDGTSDQHRDTIWFQVFTQDDGQMGEFTPYAQRGVRTRDWLYVRHKDRRVMLYDQRNDYDEQNNLVYRPEHSALMDDFDARIAAHMAATGDDWDMAANFPPPNFLSHAEAKDYLENVLLPTAIEVP